MLIHPEYRLKSRHTAIMGETPMVLLGLALQVGAYVHGPWQPPPTGSGSNGETRDSPIDPRPAGCGYQKRPIDVANN